MRLYSRTGATSVTHGGETYSRGDDGAFEFPEPVAMELRAYHVGKQPMWEDDIELRARLTAEEMDRRRDPATLLSAVDQLVRAAQAITPAQDEPEQDDKPKTSSSARRKLPAKS